MVTDFFGTELEDGDFIVYPFMRFGRPGMAYGQIQEVEEADGPRARPRLTVRRILESTLAYGQRPAPAKTIKVTPVVLIDAVDKVVKVNDMGSGVREPVPIAADDPGYGDFLG